MANTHGIIDPDNLLVPLQAASCTYRIAFGPRAGRKVHGVLAPHAKLRAAIVPIPAQTTTAHAVDCDHAHGAPARMSWARLLKRVFDIDVERCVCGGKLKIIAAIEAPAVIDRHAPGIVGSTAASRAGAARRLAKEIAKNENVLEFRLAPSGD